MDCSAHPVVVEYAVRECFKHRSPRKAAEITKQKLGGTTNLFVAGGTEVVEIDVQQLENQVWLRMGARARESQKYVKPGFEEWILGGVLQEFGQKETPKNLAQLKDAMRYLG